MPLSGVSAERFITAPAETIFALLADPSRHRDIDGSGTVRDAVEGSVRLGLGDTFGMQMKAGGSYRMINTVVEFEADRRIAWQARPAYGWLQKAIGGRIWRYELEPRDGGTLVRETWDISQEQLPALIWGLRGPTRISMNRTLKRIEELVA
ncbi:MAG: dimethyladenosine transferase [Frankiales bacterium]|nr:dimethyladenosine transferase [Frankiales bacterium]